MTINVDEEYLGTVLRDAYTGGGKPSLMRFSEPAAKWYRRWIKSGDLYTAYKREHRRVVKAARRRNRGRGPFARRR